MTYKFPFKLKLCDISMSLSIFFDLGSACVNPCDTGVHKVSTGVDFTL